MSNRSVRNELNEGEMAVIAAINTEMHIKILNYFIIPSIENIFDKEVIFLDNNASSHRQESKLFLKTGISTQ